MCSSDLVFLPGPDPSRLPKGSTGLHQILLRIEATNESEARSELSTGFVSSGGVAGFPLPTFRYNIVPKSSKIALLEPIIDTVLSPNQKLRFSWEGASGASGYKLEVRRSNQLVFSALLAANTTSYTAPPWLKKVKGQALSWKIQALKSTSNEPSDLRA